MCRGSESELGRELDQGAGACGFNFLSTEEVRSAVKGRERTTALATLFPEKWLFVKM